MAVKIGGISLGRKVNGQTRATVNWPSATLDDWFADGFSTNTAGVDVTSDSALKHSA